MNIVQNLLDFIGSAEAGPAGYGATWGNVADRDFSGMTLDQVIADALSRGQRYGSGATGRYQFMGPTLQGLKRNLGLTGNEPFTPELQDVLGTELLREKGLEDFLTGGITAEQFGSNLADVWAGLPFGPQGVSRFHGVMGNEATTTWDELMRVLGGGDVQGGGGFTHIPQSGLPQRRDQTGSLIHPQIAQLFGQQQMTGGPLSFLGDPLISLGAHIMNAQGNPDVFGSGITAGIANWQAARQQAGQNQLDLRMQMLQASNELYDLEHTRRTSAAEQADMERKRQMTERLAARYDQTNPALADALRAGAVDKATMGDLLVPEEDEWEIKTIQEGDYKRTMLFNPQTREIRPIEGTGMPAEAPIGPLPSGVKHSDVQSARGQYNALPEVKTYNAAKTQYDSLVNVLEDLDNPQANLAAIFAFMKAMDPTSVVRPEEAEAPFKAEGPMAWFASQINQIIGKGGINVGTRKNIIEAAEASLRGVYGPARRAYDRYNKVATDQYRLQDPYVITGDAPQAPELPEYMQASPGTPAEMPPVVSVEKVGE